ncbi:ATP-grasp domain-containing protein [Winogradskyella sp. 3972H.M.0a.05]|uniref:ATP-grasp domain-containing protein n=1 Tax=Winogradskyella sp. 3972H.M.0a.05 TaxID=2950277 RepID=UPI0033978F15
MAVGKTFSVLIPDGESAYSYGAITCFSGVKGVKVFLMSDKKVHEMRWSNLVQKLLYYPKEHYDEQWINHINEVCDQYDIDVIMPTSEEGIKGMLKHSNALNAVDKLSLLPPEDSFNIATNKIKLGKHLNDYDINAPIDFQIQPGDDYNRIESEIGFPVILKPAVDNNGGKGITTCNSTEAVSNFFEDHNITIPYLVQEYIEGYDIDCSVLCKNGAVLAHTIQKGTMHGRTIYEPQLAFDFLENEKLLNIVKDLMKSLNWSGVAHVDLRYDSKTDTFKIIEISPRFWGSVLASMVTNVNFSYLSCRLILDKQLPEIDKQHYVSFVTTAGLWKHIKKNPMRLFYFTQLWNYTAVKYVIKDPLPVLYKVFRRIRRFF